jgi:sugar lactone lactonase YvrE
MADLTNQLQAAAGNVAAPSGGWDLANAALFQRTADNQTINSLIKVKSFSVATQELVPTGVFFKPDGTKMYIVGSNGDDVNEYSLSTAWDVTTASYVQNFSVATQDVNPQGLFFKTDGTKMYMIGSSSDAIHEYDLSTAWDISTASINQNFSVATEDTSPFDLFIKDDGTKLYMLGTSGDDVNEYTLSTAWDISTASYVQNFSVATEETAPAGITFLADGTKMYVFGPVSDGIHEYTLSTAWDISTASYSNKAFFAPGTNYSSLFMNPNNFSIFVSDTVSDTVIEFVFTEVFSVVNEETNPYGISFKSDGTKMYIVGSSGDDINEYDLSTAWDVSTASYVQNFSLASQTTAPFGLFFKPDGTSFYIGNGSEILQYDLSTAWDVSTASYVNTSGNTGYATANLYIKLDGTKVYGVDYFNDSIIEYDLSTAWDITTLSHVQNFSVATEDTQPIGIYFKPDGTKMYVTGTIGDDVIEYSLSTAWDVSTASYVQNFAVNDNAPYGIYIKDDGTKFWVLGAGFDSVVTYSM